MTPARFKIALCNEVIAGRDFAAQCAYAAALGYDGIELAPFTLGEDPSLLGPHEAARLRDAAAAAGVAVTGLHWLLVKPAGLSIATPDPAVHARTIDVLRRLVELCAALGGSVLVHGSPAQRGIAAGQSHADALERATAAWAAAGEAARQAGVTYCIEPLSRDQTPIVNTIAEAAEIVRRIGNPALRTMIDTSSASLAEAEPPAALIERWWPTGVIAHVQVNDRNRRGPGQGGDRFAPVLAALTRVGYDRVVAVEPFDYAPDGPGAASRAIGYLRGILEAQAAP
ncbi:MAG: sugar phosphate isomerase/epimerase [Proteobacteria bacterium]|nr:sugar phosphate isomerase/epimerase [Pseudomonadota bacterium]